MERMTDLKRKKLWVEQETGQVYTPKRYIYIESYKYYTESNLKQRAEGKNLKTLDV